MYVIDAIGGYNLGWNLSVGTFDLVVKIATVCIMRYQMKIKIYQLELTNVCKFNKPLYD